MTSLGLVEKAFNVIGHSLGSMTKMGIKAASKTLRNHRKRITTSLDMPKDIALLDMNLDRLS